MFGLFAKKPKATSTQAEAPVKSNREILRENLDESLKKLEEIKGTRDAQYKVREGNNEVLNTLKLREVDLNDAITFAKARIAEEDNPTVKATLQVHVERAISELAENKDKQEPLVVQNEAIGQFLDNLQNDLNSMERKVTKLNLQLSALEVRENGVTINTNLLEGNSTIVDYKREVYTAEARSELASGRY